MFFKDKNGTLVSPWHDIPLYAGEGTLNFVVEIPKESSAKFEVATVGGRSFSLANAFGGQAAICCEVLMRPCCCAVAALRRPAVPVQLTLSCLRAWPCASTAGRAQHAHQAGH